MYMYRYMKTELVLNACVNMTVLLHFTYTITFQNLSTLSNKHIKI